ncbi:MAG: DJ-1 family protein [Chitinivibrionales bacterium]|nr:DJ-1 family protein [Chitinivibrionales bacterium]
MTKSAVILLAEGFEESEAVISIDLLRRAGVSLQVAGCGSTEICGAHSLRLGTDTVLNEISSVPDCLILPGGQPGTDNLRKSEQVLSLVRKAYAEEKLCAAICAAPIVFAGAGILKAKKATCFPGFEDKLEGAEFVAKDVVTDGTIITSRGVGTAIPFALTIIKHLVDENTSNKIGKAILHY